MIARRVAIAPIQVLVQVLEAAAQTKTPVASS